MKAAALEFIPELRRRTYMMSVRSRTRTKVFGASLREPLPVIPTPLRPTDRDVSLNIQQIYRPSLRPRPIHEAERPAHSRAAALAGGRLVGGNPVP